MVNHAVVAYILYTFQISKIYFLDHFHEFVTDARSQHEVLASMAKKMDKNFQDISVFYAFDRKKYGCEELFGDIKMFIGNFEVSF